MVAAKSDGGDSRNSSLAAGEIKEGKESGAGTTAFISSFSNI